MAEDCSRSVWGSCHQCTGGKWAASLPGQRMGLLLAEEEQPGSILSSQMLVMLPTFLFTEANSKHLFFFKFSDMRHEALARRGRARASRCGTDCPCQLL